MPCSVVRPTLGAKAQNCPMLGAKNLTKSIPYKNLHKLKLNYHIKSKPNKGIN